MEHKTAPFPVNENLNISRTFVHQFLYDRLAVATAYIVILLSFLLRMIVIVADYTQQALSFDLRFLLDGNHPAAITDTKPLTIARGHRAASVTVLFEWP